MHGSQGTAPDVGNRMDNKEVTATYDSDCDQALGWITRFRADNVSDQDRQHFALWLAGAPERRRAMDDMLELWDDLGVAEALPFPNLATEPAANQSHWFTAGAAAIAACLVAAIVLWPATTPQPYSLQTAFGEQQTFDLPDGSRVTLNTDSRMTVTYSEQERRIDLDAGEAFFEVSANKERPFIVDAGAAEATVLGTAFNVYRREDRTTITVTEGVVRVTGHRHGNLQRPASEVLRVDQQIIATSAGLKASATVDTRPLVSWRDWELVANEMRLYDLVKELERYDDRRSLLGDRDVAAMAVSGVFPLDQPDALLQALTRALDLQLVELDQSTWQLLKAAN